MTDPSEHYTRPTPPSKAPYVLAAAGLIAGSAIAMGYVNWRMENARPYAPAARSDTLVVPERTDSLAKY